MRRAFTLMELLVVVGIMALLAGIAVPAFLMIRKQARTTNCINNLRQIGIGIKSYQSGDPRGRPPGHLRQNLSGWSVALTDAGQPMEGTPAKAFQCPFDASKGNDATMGRNTDPLLLWADLHLLHEAQCSYQYETSDAKLQESTPQDELGWFFPYASTPGQWCAMTGSARRTVGIGSEWLWSDGKAHQLAHQRVNGRVIPSGKFPILHCYYHTAWVGALSTSATFVTDWATPTTCVPLSSPVSQVIVDYPRKMLNLSWDLNVFWSRPHWESDL
jgi:prepilin-type N-terminal cleavage/methylation domain-containing protein